MKQQFKKWLLRLTATGLLMIILLLIIVLNPVLTYAHHTKHTNFTIYHEQTLHPTFIKQLDHAHELIKKSEFYNPHLQLDICLNDGSVYPTLIQKLRGRAFAWGFYNKVVLQGAINYDDQTVELNGYKWNLHELLAHEITHCLQFDKFGLFNSNPLAGIPAWKWEGYAEYIARQSDAHGELAKNLDRLANANSIDENSWQITLADGTICPREYYNYLLLMQYCLDIKKMNYQQVLADTTSESIIHNEMMRWYELR